MLCTQAYFFRTSYNKLTRERCISLIWPQIRPPELSRPPSRAQSHQPFGRKWFSLPLLLQSFRETFALSPTPFPGVYHQTSVANFQDFFLGRMLFLFPLFLSIPFWIGFGLILHSNLDPQIEPNPSTFDAKMHSNVDNIFRSTFNRF